MFEHKSQRLLSLTQFAARMGRSGLWVLGIAVLSLALGTVGYCYFADLSAVDGLLNAAMILTGMGPVDRMTTNAGKLFASFYALYSGIAFLSMMALLTAPIFHRIIHKFHLEDDHDDDHPAEKAPR
ncbi:MAG: hypothetical protein QM775_14500 [Pirellulales bacterium]